MTSKILMELVLFTGVIAAFRPLWLARKFHGVDELGTAIAYMFLGEAWGFILTICFGFLAYFGLFADVPTWVTWTMRLAMFIPAIVTTHHLAKVCDRLRKNGQ